MSWLRCLENTNTSNFPWDSNAFLTLSNKLWKRYSAMSMTLIYIQWYWCLFFHLGISHLTPGQNSTSIRSQWFHHHSNQMQMDHPGNDWLRFWLMSMGLKSQSKKLMGNQKSFLKCVVFLLPRKTYIASWSFLKACLLQYTWGFRWGDKYFMRCAIYVLK